MAVDDVLAEDEGDVEAGFLDGEVLKVVGGIGTDNIEEGTDLAFGGEVVVFQFGGVGAGGVAGVVLDQLAEFLLERHLFEQGVDAGVEFF